MAETPQQRFRWWVAIASLVLLTMGTGSQYVVVVGMKAISAEMGWPRSVPSAAYAFALLGMGLGGIVMGRWSDRVGVARPAALGALMLFAGAWLASFSHQAWVLVLANGLFMGLLGTAAFFTPLLANITRWFTSRRGLAVALVSAGQALGGALWPPLHRYFVDEMSWRTAYLVYGTAALVVCLPLSLVLRRRPPIEVETPPPGRPGRAPERPQVLGLAPNVVHALLSLAIVGCCVAMAMPMVQVVAHASDLGHSAARSAEILSVLLLAAFASRFFWGALSDRIGGLTTLLLGSLSQALVLTLFLVVESLHGLYLIAALYGLAYGGIVPSYSVIVREHFPVRELGMRIGVVYLFGTLGMALGGTAGGLVFDVAGNYFAAFGVGIAFNVANLAIIAPLVLRERRLAVPPAAVSPGQVASPRA